MKMASHCLDVDVFRTRSQIESLSQLTWEINVFFNFLFKEPRSKRDQQSVCTKVDHRISIYYLEPLILRRVMKSGAEHS